MFTAVSGPDRRQLGFSEAVKSSFAFVKRYGLKIVQEEVTLVRYQSDQVILNVYHGRGSYELGVEFQRAGFPGPKFGLYDVLKWAASTGKIGQIPTEGYQASSQESVQKLVVRMAELVKQYAVPLLQGDATAYLTVQDQQSQDAAEYTREAHLRGIRKQAEAAWQDKDYETLFGLYSGIQRDLTPSEFMRLQYAEKRMLAVRTDHPHSL
jgi:hypothetical protein